MVLGSYLVFLAAAISVFLAIDLARVLFRSTPPPRRVRWLVLAESLLLVGASIELLTLLIGKRFEFEYVASYTSSALPTVYAVAAFWAGQEGTFLLWALIGSVMAIFLLRQPTRLAAPALFFVNLAQIFLFTMLLVRSPFRLAAHAPLDGNGLNPLLQDPWMIAHPPALFVGYASLVVLFAYAAVALLRRDYEAWIQAAFPWALFTIITLGIGIFLGGIWAYKVLGWGGFWGWDPVENFSLIPWLLTAALFHGILIQRATGALRRLNLFLALTGFVAVLYGSFLTRSGFLADFSVHSFTDLGLNRYLILFLATFGLAGYGLLAVRFASVPHDAIDLRKVTRESALWVGAMVLLAIAFLTAIGTSAPLLTRITGNPSNVRTSYYNLVNLPLAIVMALLVAVAPFLRWKANEMGAIVKTALPSLVLAIAATLLGVFRGVTDPLLILLLLTSAFAVAGNLLMTARAFRRGWKLGAGYLTHVGLALMLIGILTSTRLGRSEKVTLREGETKTALGYTVSFDGIEETGGGRTGILLQVGSGSSTVAAEPSLTYNSYAGSWVRSPAIRRDALRDLYLAPLDLVEAEHEHDATWLPQNQAVTLGDVTYRFLRFDMGSHGDKMQVVARIEATRGGKTVEIAPALVVGSGTPEYVADRIEGGPEVRLVKVDADEKRVAIEIPGEAPAAGGLTLTLEASTKPLINLLWLGSILLIAGSILAAARRAAEPIRESVKRGVVARADRKKGRVPGIGHAREVVDFR